MTQSYYANMSIPNPPLSEQKAIADFLDEKCGDIDRAAAGLERQMETLREYKKSLISETVTKGLDKKAELKDSGIPWIGKIPKDWKVIPVYSYFKERKCINYKGAESNLLSLSYGNIIRKDKNTNEGLLPANFLGYNVVEPGNIVLRFTDLQNDKRSLRTGLVKERGIITSAYVTLEAYKDLCPSYFHYLLHAYDIKKVFYNLGAGVRQSLNYTEFSKLRIFSPPLSEQKAIADFLDQKCAAIDQILAGKEKQLALLQEYRKSLIYEYVTGKKEVPYEPDSQ